MQQTLAELYTAADLFDLIGPDGFTLLMLGFIFGARALRQHFKKNRPATSMFAADDILDAVGTTLLGGAIDSAPDRVLGGKTTYRPTWGARLFLPLLALGLLWAIDVEAILPEVTGMDRAFNQALIYGLSGVILLHWFMTLFIQRVTVDEVSITSHGAALGAQTRDLKDLREITFNHKRRMLKLTFLGAKPILIPNHLSQRAEFIDRMERQIARNMANPARPVASRW